MTRPLKAAIAATLLALGIALFLPTLAAAADAAPWVGTYKGVAVGKDKKGKSGKSGVTIWVEDLGGSTKFTFRFDKFPVVFDQTAPNAGGQNGSMLVRFAVSKAGVNGTGMIVLYPRDGNYMIAGKGAGKAAGKQGTGRMSAVRMSTGVDLPSTTQQIKDLFSTLFGKKISSATSASSAAIGGSSAAPAVRPIAIVSDDADAVYASAEVTSEAASTADEAQAVVIKKAPTVVFVQAVEVEPASGVDLAAAKPPATTQTVITTLGLLIVLTVAAAIVSVGPKVRRQAAAATADAPRDDEEGS